MRMSHIFAIGMSLAFVGSEFRNMFSKTSNTATVGSGNKAIPTLVYQLEGNPRNVSHAIHYVTS